MTTKLAMYRDFVTPEGIYHVSVFCALLNKLYGKMYNNDI